MKKNSTTEYADILFEITKNQDTLDIEKTMHVYAKFLKKRRMLGKIDEILKKYDSITQGQKKIVYATLFSTEKLDDKDEKEIIKIFKKEVDASDIEVENKIDKNLIAGWKIKTNEFLIDASLRGRLNKMKKNLVK